MRVPERGAQNVESNVTRFRHWIKGLADMLWPPQRIEMTVQTDRLLIISRRRSSTDQPRRVWCQQCGRSVNALNLQEAGSLASAAQPALPGTAKSETWHVCTGEDGEQLVCVDSLLDSIGGRGEM